jgi:hypothetical protein
MDDSNFYTKINFLSQQNDKKEKLSHFSLDINDSFYSSFLKDKFISIENNEIDDKSFNNNNFESILGKEKESINNLNDNKIIVTNKEQTKKQLRLKRNREYAKEGRLRKKIYQENLINQIKKLQIQNSILLKIILNCSQCKKEYEKETELENNNKNNYYILNDTNTISNKKKLLFMTAIALISIFNLFNIFYLNQGQDKISNKRNLSVKEQRDVLINKIKSTSNEEEAIFIQLSEFYSLTTREKVDGKFDLNKEMNKNVKIYNKDTFNIKKLNQTNEQNCVKCVMEVDKKSIMMGGDEFTFYLVDRALSKSFMNNLEDGTFPELDFEKENKKSEAFSKVFALKCKIIAYSINNIYSDKIGTIS